MFTSNPFAELAAFLPPIAMQVYIILMVIALLIALGLLVLAIAIPLRLIFGRKDESWGDDWDHVIYDAGSDIDEEQESDFRDGESGDDHSNQAGTKIGRKSPRRGQP